MALNYRDLLAKAGELDRQIAAAREVEAAAALAEIKAKIAEFDFTVEDVFSTKKRGSNAGVAARRIATRSRARPGAEWGASLAGSKVRTARDLLSAGINIASENRENTGLSIL
jgi:H-NS histone family